MRCGSEVWWQTVRQNSLLETGAPSVAFGKTIHRGGRVMVSMVFTQHQQHVISKTVLRNETWRTLYLIRDHPRSIRTRGRLGVTSSPASADSHPVSWDRRPTDCFSAASSRKVSTAWRLAWGRFHLPSTTRSWTVCRWSAWWSASPPRPSTVSWTPVSRPFWTWACPASLSARWKSTESWAGCCCRSQPATSSVCLVSLRCSPPSRASRRLQPRWLQPRRPQSRSDSPKSEAPALSRVSRPAARRNEVDRPLCALPEWIPVRLWPAVAVGSPPASSVSSAPNPQSPATKWNEIVWLSVAKFTNVFRPCITGRKQDSYKSIMSMDYVLLTGHWCDPFFACDI